jgi:hypothetical protein
VWVARRRSRAYAFCAWAITQFFFLVSLVPFRSRSLADAMKFLRETLWVPGADALRFPSAVDAPVFFLIVVFFVGHHLVTFAPGSALARRFFALPAPLRGIAYGVVIVVLALLVPVGAGTFIYAQF